MLNKIKNIGKDELVRGSFVLFIMIVLYNFFNYLFQISMAKLLGPSDYSILAALMSIIYVFGIPSEAIQTIITKHISILSVKNENGKIKDLMIRSLKKGLYVSIILFIIFFFASFFISRLLDINNYLVLLTGLFIFLSFLLPSIRGLLQGTKRFFNLGMNLIFESVSKLIISLALVYLAFHVYGAIIAVLLGSVLALLLALFYLRKLFTSKRERFDSKDIYSSSMPIIIATLSIVLLYSIDIILARRFFSPQLAGQYAFISLIGKVIIFVSSAIGKAMFPLSTGEFNLGIKNNNLLKKSLILVSLMAAISLLFYATIPEFIVGLISLGSKDYISASNILFYLGLAYSFISLSNIIILHQLSQNKLNNYSSLSLLIFFLIESILLYIFNNTLFEYSIAVLFSSLLIFLYSLSLIRK